jgi:putative acetyltransferase
MVTIIEYEKKHHEDFRRLNMEWLEKYDLLETHDTEILDDPQSTVLDGGGVIFLAVEEDKVIGTAGLFKENEEELELIKMAVDERSRGKGVSKILLDKCLDHARSKNAKRIFLYSNSQLKAALSLYEKYGFRHIDASQSPFATADVKMELHL